MTRPHWTPALASEAMVEAARWLRATARPDGPAGIRSSMPIFIPTQDDFLAEGWGLPDAPDPDEIPERLIPPGPERIAQYEAALLWPGHLIAPYDRDLARAVQAHVAAQAARRPLKHVARERGLSPSTCARWRDRGLSFLSVSLDRSGVRPW